MNDLKRVPPGSMLALRLSVAERDLVCERALLEPEIEAKLRSARRIRAGLEVAMSLDDIDELLGCVAAEANHSTVRQERALFFAVCEKLNGLLETHSDEPPTSSVRDVPWPSFTAAQGQYLAFIYYFAKLHRRAPAEADLQAYFQTSPPSIHRMIMTLERRGFITKVPGVGRSIQLLLERSQLPDLT